MWGWGAQTQAGQGAEVKGENSLLGQHRPLWEDWKRRGNRAEPFPLDAGV